MRSLFSTALFLSVTTLGLVAGAQCKIHLKDSLNHMEADLVAQQVPDAKYKEKYVVTLNPGKEFEDVESVSFDGTDSPMIATLSVPHPTKKELLADYKNSIDTLLNKHIADEGQGQIVYSVDQDNQCNSIEATLIEFFVNEFFFYG